MALAKVAGRYGFISKGQCGPLLEVLVVVAEARYRRRGRDVHVVGLSPSGLTSALRLERGEILFATASTTYVSK